MKDFTIIKNKLKELKNINELYICNSIKKFIIMFILERFNYQIKRSFILINKLKKNVIIYLKIIGLESIISFVIIWDLRESVYEDFCLNNKVKWFFFNYNNYYLYIYVIFSKKLIKFTILFSSEIWKWLKGFNDILIEGRELWIKVECKRLLRIGCSFEIIRA